MDFSVATILLAAAPALIAALLPRKWVSLAFGWIAFALAMIFLDVRPSLPFVTNERLGSWESWLWLSAGFAAAAAAIRYAVDILRWSPPPKLDFDQRILLSWELPIGLVVAILLFFGLSEALAGFRPAWLAHLLVIIGLGTGFAVLLMKLVKARDIPRRPMGLAAVILIGMTIQLCGAIVEAFLLSGYASSFADGEPYCIIGFDRAGRPRAAASTFELSPLVMRSGGRYGVDVADWLVVRNGSRPVLYTYSYYKRPRMFEIAPGPQNSPQPCTPPKGGADS